MMPSNTLHYASIIYILAYLHVQNIHLISLDEFFSNMLFYSIYLQLKCMKDITTLFFSIKKKGKGEKAANKDK